MATYMFAHINWNSTGATAVFYFLRSNTKTVPSEADAPTWKFIYVYILYMFICLYMFI